MPKFARAALQAARSLHSRLLANLTAAPPTAPAPPAGAVTVCHPPTMPAEPWRPILARPRATAAARLTHALIVAQYNLADRGAQAALTAAGWPAEGYVMRPC